MASFSTVDARDHFSELINRVSYGKERIKLKRRGKSLVALIPLEDLQKLEEFEDMMDVIEAQKAKEEIAKKGTKSLKSVFKDLGQ